MPVETLILLAAITGSGLVHGVLGFGSGMVAMSVLATTHGLLHAAAVVNGTGVVIATALAITLRRHVQWNEIRMVLPPALIGVVIGVTALDELDGTLMTRALGITVMAISSYYFLKGQDAVRLTGRAGATTAGFLAGCLGGAMNMTGPPLIAYFYARPDPPLINKANVQVIFAVGGTTRMMTSISRGMVNQEMFIDMALATPCLIGAMFVGMAIARRMSPERFRRVSWAAFALLGLSLAIRA